MLFLVELDHVKSGTMLMPEAGREFISRIILPTLAISEELLADKKILAGGPVVGRVSLRFILQVDSLQDVDKVLTNLPIWPHADTRATPLVSFGDRRAQVEALQNVLSAMRSQE
jgi:hypothetical protein